MKHETENPVVLHPGSEQHMRPTESQLSIGRLGWATLAGGVSYVVGQMVGGGLAMGLGLQPPNLKLAVSQGLMLAGQLAGGVVVSIGVGLVARHMGGGFVSRCGALAAFLYLAHGLNTALEASIFTTMGGGWMLVVAGLPASILCAAVVARAVPALPKARPMGEQFAGWAASRSAWSWTGRLALAVAAFPVIYYCFGMMIAPLVIEYYRRPGGFLRLPAPQVVIGMQMLRSVIFLVASLPIVACWSGSRAQMIVKLGLAHFCLVGLAGLIVPGLLPMWLRFVHGSEIFADSMVYAWVLASLLRTTYTHGSSTFGFQMGGRAGS